MTPQAPFSSLRIFGISAALAFLLLLPALNEWYDWGIARFYGLGIPAAGMDYLCTFFHEIGHTVTSISFGTPAFPSFDFEHGGGMTYSSEHSPSLSVLMYLLLGGAIVWLWRSMYPGLAIGLFCFGALHAALLLSGGAEAAVSFMGHGAEILLAGFLLWRILALGAEHRPIDAYLNTTFSFFIFGTTLLTCRMMFSDIGGAAYAQQKGGHVKGDFEALAHAWGMGLPGVACVYLTLMAAVIIAAVSGGFWLRQNKAL